MQADWPNVRFDSAAVEPRAAVPAVIGRDTGRRPPFNRRKEQLLAHRIAELHHLYRQFARGRYLGHSKPCGDGRALPNRRAAAYTVMGAELLCDPQGSSTIGI
jgi:hypothetical protein